MDKVKTYDALTGIYNFKTFINETDKMLKADPEGEYVILVWDVVQFKVVNDLFGMEAGDRLLKEIADDMRLKMHERGTYGRIGSDKFVCCALASNYQNHIVNNIYEFYINEEVGMYKVLMQGGCYLVTDRDTPIIKMCDRALLALSRIKGKYTETVAQYSNSNREEVIMRRQLVSDLDRGIRERQFEAYVQPIYYTRTNKIASGEVLVRWNHPKFGMLTPGRFVGVFEENYLITKLDKYMWEEACRMIRRMIDTKERVVPLSINVSRTDFLYDDLCDVLLGLTAKYDIPNKYLRIEITESAYMDNPDKLIHMAQRLKDEGFMVLMDDFGTGYSSLNTLKDLPFDIVKIDKKLIDEIDSSEKAGNVVYSIIRMARWLGMKAIAEGVEKISQVNFLKHTGCKYIQGYYYSKPIPEEEFFAKGFNDKFDTDADSDEVNLDNMFGLRDPEERTLLNRDVGAMVWGEYNGDDIIYKQVNSEYCALFKMTPHEVYTTFNLSSYIGRSDGKDILVSKCMAAMNGEGVSSAELSRYTKDGGRVWVRYDIYYIGKENGRPQFIFKISDVTKEHRARNKRQIDDFYPILRNSFSEILLMDYTDNTITTLFCDESYIKIKHDSENLAEKLDLFFNRMIAPEDRERMKIAFSKESMAEFIASDNMLIRFQANLVSKNDEKRTCEFLILKNDDDMSKVSVYSCSRIIKQNVT